MAKQINENDVKKINTLIVQVSDYKSDYSVDLAFDNIICNNINFKWISSHEYYCGFKPVNIDKCSCGITVTCNVNHLEKIGRGLWQVKSENLLCED